MSRPRQKLITPRSTAADIDVANEVLAAGGGVILGDPEAPPVTLPGSPFDWPDGWSDMGYVDETGWRADPQETV